MENNTQPTDSQMLDWMIRKEARIINQGNGLYFVRTFENASCDYDEPRTAIAAEMAKEEVK